MAQLVRVLVFLGTLGVIIAYLWLPPAKFFEEPETARIVVFHVPSAMLCSLYFLWGAVMAGMYLARRQRRYDHSSLASIEMGFLLCILATLTGMVFARQQWGAYWQWDPRQTSILLQLLIYAAYFALRQAFHDPERARIHSAAYAVFAFISVPFLIWILPRIPQIQEVSLHAGANRAVVAGGLDPAYRAVFYASLLMHLILTMWCFRLRVRQATLNQKLEELYAVADSGSPTTHPRVVRAVRLPLDR
jgi:heme exporter protein C